MVHKPKNRIVIIKRQFIPNKTDNLIKRIIKKLLKNESKI